MPALVIPTLATLCKVFTFLTSLVSFKLSIPKVILMVSVPKYFFASISTN
nr:MAG TPA: hypothetical protein [Caudoviricetes sp.]